MKLSVLYSFSYCRRCFRPLGAFTIKSVKGSTFGIVPSFVTVDPRALLGFVIELRIGYFIDMHVNIIAITLR